MWPVVKYDFKVVNARMRNERLFVMCWIPVDFGVNFLSNLGILENSLLRCT